MRDFKKRHGGPPSSVASTPKKSATSTPRATPRKRTPAKRKASSEEESDEDNEPTVKKLKTEKDVKKEENYARNARERRYVVDPSSLVDVRELMYWCSATVMDNDAKFRTWLKEDTKEE